MVEYHTQTGSYEYYQNIFEKQLDIFVTICIIRKSKFAIPEMGSCTDLEYKLYIKDYGFVCKCGKMTGI